MVRPSTLLVAVVAHSALLEYSALGFVTLIPVRRQHFQSTSTSNTYEPAHILTDAYTRNPFEGLEEECIDFDFDSEDSMNHLIPKWPGVKRMSQVFLSARYRQQLQKKIIVSWHHSLRDSGALRSIMDALVSVGTPALAMEHPEIVPTFLNLTRDCIQIPYGSHKRQGMDMYFPTTREPPRGLLYFVHGGAWGSGLRWMYRLVAQPFLDQGMAVALIGYRTFPDGDMSTQVEDLELAAQELAGRYPELCVNATDLGVCVMGHSSGAHISMEMIVNRIQRELIIGGESRNPKHPMRIDSFVGLSAPYEIASHYEFETRRGLEELSPMKAACGHNKERLSEFSPIFRLNRMLANRTNNERQSILKRHFPHVAMYHGLQDDTVPWSSTRQAAQLLRYLGVTQCDEIYFPETGHSDTAFELMFGGKTRHAVLNWLLQGQAGETNPLQQTSRYSSCSMQQSSARFASQDRTTSKGTSSFLEEAAATSVDVL